jgi:AmmeMemoRadiSam system protein B
LSSVLPPDENVTLISTSNLTHYLNYDECCRIDSQILSQAIKMNIDLFYQTVERYSHIICGYGCIASAMEFSRMVGNSDAIVLKHLTSGDSDGNKSSVVGYASVVMV